jgi:hypothetical protein
MAIIATLIGGIFGFASFLTALLAFDATFLTASTVYMLSGFAITAVLIIIGMIPTRTPDPEKQNALSA